VTGRLVCRSRADEDELATAVAEQFQVQLQVSGFESHEIHDDVEIGVTEYAPGRPDVTDVGDQLAATNRRRRGAPPVQQRDRVSALQRQLHAATADDSGTADKKQVHARLLAGKNRDMSTVRENEVGKWIRVIRFIANS
jgi:hypothetical protein